MTPNPPNPLPRSLEPLPHESLPGYLLRLAHRLDSWPGRIATLTGLESAGHTLPASRMFALQPAMADTFAAVTRLSLAEVNALTLASLGSRYPPLDPGFSGRQRQIHGIFVKENWVFSRASRYCPDCLAGDGSTIQQQHGGAWSTLWRLPVVFVCPTHRRLLLHTCSACDTPAHFRPGTSDQMLSLSGHAGLHPAQCRAPVSEPAAGQRGRKLRACGYRLDNAPPAEPTGHGREHRELHHFQQRLLNLLGAEAPQATTSAGEDTAPSHYFVDLRILACLISASWPAARDLVDQPEQARLLDRHVRQARRDIRAIRASGRTVRELAFYDTPPLAATSCAALLTLADRILAASDTSSLRELLHPLVASAPAGMQLWTRQFLAGDGYCSRGLQTALGPEVRNQHVMKRLGMRRQAPSPSPRPVRFGIQHIPQHLRPEWYGDYLAGITTVKPCLLRRAAAARLAQLCLGGPASSAAEHLGIPQAATINALTVVHQRLDRASQRAFDDAVNAIAERLNHARHATDFGRRRRALRDWAISGEEWNELTSDLRARPCRRAGRWTGRPFVDWGEKKRVLASMWVWVRITCGEHILAPAIRPHLDQRRPSSAHRGDIHSRWPLISANQPTGHYTALRERLDSYADTLAADIDAVEIAPVGDDPI